MQHKYCIFLRFELQFQFHPSMKVSNDCDTLYCLRFSNAIQKIIEDGFYTRSHWAHLVHCLIKGILHPRMKILSFTNPQVVPNLYEFLQTQKKIFWRMSVIISNSWWSPFTSIIFFFLNFGAHQLFETTVWEVWNNLRVSNYPSNNNHKIQVRSLFF